MRFNATMKRPIACALLAAFLMLACAPSSKFPTKHTYIPGTRVGIANMLENYATHQHFSSARIDSLSEKYEVNWKMPEYITDRLTKFLQEDGRYTVISVNKTEFEDLMILQRGLVDPSNNGQLQTQLQPQWTRKLGFLADQHDLDVILVVYGFRGPGPHKIGQSRIDLDGYGVFSRWSVPLKILPFKNAYSYAQIGICVYKGNPVTLIATGKPRIKKTAIHNFDWSHGPKNVPVSEIDKALPGVRKYAQKAVKRALQNAGLIEQP
jgi:hypothetical protein